MNLKLTLTAALAAVALITATGSAFAAPGVALNTVNVREEPELGDNVIGQLAKGEFINIIECDAGWCAIDDDGDEGYVSASYLALVDYDDEDDYDDDDHDHGHHHHHDHDDVDVDVDFEVYF
jgi:uncharacterized protein YraI